MEEGGGSARMKEEGSEPMGTASGGRAPPLRIEEEALAKRKGGVGKKNLRLIFPTAPSLPFVELGSLFFTRIRS